VETLALQKRFGGIAAVRDVSLRIETGARHALIGPHGAGKTTVIDLLSGAKRPASGRILLEGRISRIPCGKAPKRAFSRATGSSAGARIPDTP